MADLKTQVTAYPTALDSATLIQDGQDTAVAMHHNGPNSAIVAIETELGVNPSGSSADVATRLNINMHGDGGLLRGSAFPVAPPNVPHYFYKTDEQKLYIYNTTTASYDAVTTAVVLAAYVQKDVPTTLTAVHTFNPSSTGAPFILGANATGQLVTGLSAATAVTATNALKITAGTSSVNMKVLNIGNWNMDGGALSVSVAHGVFLTKIRSVSVTILNDAGTEMFAIDDAYTIDSVSGNWSADGTNINVTNLSRSAPGGTFVGADFDASNVNRGYITIWYVD